MTGADKLIGGNSNITLYYFHGRANVVNLMWLAYVNSIRILLSRWPIKMYFTELLDRCKADIWRHAGCNFCKQEWYYLLRYGTGVIIMASKPTKTVRHQKFLTEYTAKWDFIVPSVKGETYARCNSCNSDFSIKSSGAYDIKIHIESAKHKSSAKARASNHAITSFFASEKDDFSVIRAETWNAKRPLLSIISPCPKGTCSDEYIGKSLVTFKQFYVTHLFVKAILRLALITLSKNMWIDWKCIIQKDVSMYPILHIFCLYFIPTLFLLLNCKIKVLCLLVFKACSISLG